MFANSSFAFGTQAAVMIKPCCLCWRHLEPAFAQFRVQMTCSNVTLLNGQWTHQCIL